MKQLWFRRHSTHVLSAHDCNPVQYLFISSALLGKAKHLDLVNIVVAPHCCCKYIKHTRFSSQGSLGSQRASRPADCSTQPVSDKKVVPLRSWQLQREEEDRVAQGGVLKTESLVAKLARRSAQSHSRCRCLSKFAVTVCLAHH